MGWEPATAKGGGEYGAAEDKGRKDVQDSEPGSSAAKEGREEV